MKETKTIASVSKAFKILDYISDKKEVGATDISHGLGMGTSATYHILNTLKLEGVLHQDPVTKKFRLGIKLWQLGNRAYAQYDIGKQVAPFFKRLRDETGETINLTMLEGTEIIYLAQEESKKLVKMFTVTGAKAPLYCTGGGKAMLAFRSKEDQDNIIESLSFEAFTENTITDPKTFKEVLEKVKKEGVAYDEEEREVGVCCIAVPIFKNQEALYSVSISGPCLRFTPDKRKEYESLLKETAEEIGNHLW